jgi:hypothetical protein
VGSTMDGPTALPISVIPLVIPIVPEPPPIEPPRIRPPNVNPPPRSASPHRHVPINDPEAWGMPGCRRSGRPTTLGYLSGAECAPRDFIRDFGYVPDVQDLAWGSRAQRPAEHDGACSVRLAAHPSSFQAPCRTHDYGYDLLRAGALDSRRQVDILLFNDLMATCLGWSSFRGYCQVRALATFEVLTVAGTVPEEAPWVGHLPP